jgi:hypothetical protein
MHLTNVCQSIYLKYLKETSTTSLCTLPTFVCLSISKTSRRPRQRPYAPYQCLSVYLSQKPQGDLDNVLMHLTNACLSIYLKNLRASQDSARQSTRVRKETSTTSLCTLPTSPSRNTLRTTTKKTEGNGTLRISVSGSRPHAGKKLRHANSQKSQCPSIFNLYSHYTEDYFFLRIAPVATCGHVATAH